LDIEDRHRVQVLSGLKAARGRWAGHVPNHLSLRGLTPSQARDVIEAVRRMVDENRKRGY